MPFEVVNKESDLYILAERDLSAGAREIAGILKEWIEKGKFLLGEAVETMPTSGADVGCRPLKMRAVPR